MSHGGAKQRRARTQEEMLWARQQDKGEISNKDGMAKETREGFFKSWVEGNTHSYITVLR